jgi:hypothetical protein
MKIPFVDGSLVRSSQLRSGQGDSQQNLNLSGCVSAGSKPADDKVLFRSKREGPYQLILARWLPQHNLNLSNVKDFFPYSHTPTIHSWIISSHVHNGLCQVVTVTESNSVAPGL